MPVTLPPDARPSRRRRRPRHPPSPEALEARARRLERRRSLREDAVNLPNILTMLRIVMIPIVLVFLSRGSPRDCFFAAVVFTLAAVTDFFDGYLARKRGLVSVLGKFLDPLADKLIVMATLVWLVDMGRIAAWLVVILLAREITVTALRGIASSEGLVIAAGREGKSKTAFQMVGIICLLLGWPYRLYFGFVDLGPIDFIRVGRVLLYLSLVFSLVSAYEYLKLFSDAVEAKERRRGSGERGGGG
jgi:CDP-diacylglycerol--glycerol-3-phosphate 3-phosphatidyltransferase